MVLDSGASLGDDEAVLAACGLARDAGIHVAVMALDAAGSRLQECSEEASYRQSGRMDGVDIPEKLMTLGHGLVHGDQVENVLLTDQLAADMTYVDGSAVPEPSYVLANEMTWEFLPPPPQTGQRVTYRVSPDLTSDDLTISNSSALQLIYADGTSSEIELENPAVCVYRRTHPEDCAAFAATPTPPAPTDIPGPTDTVTPVPKATATPDARPVIYLPTVRKGHIDGS